MTDPKITILNTELKDDEDFDEDFYNADGTCNPAGLYDAGGHPVAERWMSYADDVWEREKDRRMFGE